MAVIYQADVFCDGCAEEIKSRICDDLWEEKRCDVGARCPDSTLLLDFDSCDELDDYLREMDEREYDSDSYPKYCSDDEESDCPQHCGSHAECVNAEVCADGTKIGHFFGNSLTSDGADYVRNAVREDLESGCDDSVALEFWYPGYDWIDWGDVGNCDGCGKLSVLIDYDGQDVCSDCFAKYEKEDVDPCRAMANRFLRGVYGAPSDHTDIDSCIGCPGETDGRCCASCPDGIIRTGDSDC